MTEANTLDEQIRKAVKDGLSNHTGEFANPWVFKKSYSHEELADILNDIMANERLFKNLLALFTEHSKQARIDQIRTDMKWVAMNFGVDIDVDKVIDDQIAQLSKRNKGEDNEKMQQL